MSLYCSVTATYSVLAPILETFRSTHPAVEIMMDTGDQADGISRVLAGQDDVAVSGRPARLPGRPEFLPLLESPLEFTRAPTAGLRGAPTGRRSRWGISRWLSVGGYPFIVPERGITLGYPRHMAA